MENMPSGSDRARRALTAVAVLVLSSFVFSAGCGGAETPQQKDTLWIGTTGSVDSWNPYTAEGELASPLLDLLYPRLLRETFVDGQTAFEPWLAESWQRSADGLEVTFFLRSDAWWSNGDPVTCEDVSFTFEVQRAKALAWPGAYLKKRIRSVECVGPREVRFRFSEAYPDQILDANDDAIVPVAYRRVPIEKWRATSWENLMVSCGPLTLDTAIDGQDTVLVRDERWWGARRMQIARLVIRSYADTDGVLRAFENEEIDFVPKVPVQYWRETGTKAADRGRFVPSFSYTFLGWNFLHPEAYLRDRRRRGCEGQAYCGETRDDLLRLQREAPHPVLADRRVRRALTLAIDRQDLIDGLLRGKGRIAVSPIVSLLWAHDSRPPLPYRPDESKRLLDEAGWVLAPGDAIRSKDGRRLSIEVLVNADNTLRRQALERIAANLRLVGVLAEIRLLPRGEYIARARAKNFDAIFGGWRVGTRIEPQAILHSDAALEYGNNLGSFLDAESDALLDAASHASSREEARPLWKLWQEVFRWEQPYTMVYEEPLLFAVGRRLLEVKSTAMTPFHRLEEWVLEDQPSR